MNTPYPQPSDVGGKLIRKLIATFREQGMTLPITEPTLIATSGGSDSMALAHLLSRYGRRVIDPSLITLLHIDHGWRPESATVEKNAVQELAHQLGVKFISRTAEAPPQSIGELNGGLNWERDAREKRNQIYDELTQSGGEFQWVMTAHHLNDEVETLFWRFLRGEWNDYSVGIKFKDHHQLRPFLQASKEELRAYCREEKIQFYDDPTNEDPRRTRAFFRTQLFPLIEEHFPGFESRIHKYSASQPVTASSAPVGDAQSISDTVEVLTDQRLGRHHRLKIQEWMRSGTLEGRLSLPGAYELTRTPKGFEIIAMPSVDRD